VPSGPCSQADPCSWERFVAKVGAATTITQAYFELGDSGDQFSGENCALDDVTINGVTYDFEQSAPAAPAATVSHSVIAPGGAVTVHATGFKARERVSVTLHSAGILVYTATADGSGAVTATFTVPAGIAGGDHVILLTGLTSGRTAAVPLTVPPGRPRSRSRRRRRSPEVPRRRSNWAEPGGRRRSSAPGRSSPATGAA